jgi:hypothetical protein
MSNRNSWVPLPLIPPERRYGEQLGWNLFERGRSLLETGLLDLAFVLDSFVRLGEVGLSQVPAALARTVQDRRLIRFVAIWGSAAFLLTL